MGIDIEIGTFLVTLIGGGGASLKNFTKIHSQALSLTAISSTTF